MRANFDAMKKAGLSLAFFALISVLFVSITDRLTRDKIIQNNAMMLLQALNEVVSPSVYDNKMLESKTLLSPTETGLTKEVTVYFATKNNAPIATIFEVTTLQGYNGTIKVLIGVNYKNQTLSGVRIIQHKETPGLGDKMELEKSNWVLSFNGKSLKNPTQERWQIKKDGGDFDQFTGATITPRAIVNIIRSTLLYSQNHLSKLFDEHFKKHFKNQKAEVVK